MSQLAGKFIQDNAISGRHIRLKNNEMLRGRNAANDADIDLLKVTTANLVELQQLFVVSGSLPIPSSPKQLATIEYIQNFIEGKRDAKDAVNVLKDSNLALTGSTPLVIDGVTVASGNRIALTGQSTGSQNGIYTVDISAGTYTLTRATDFDQIDDSGATEVTSGAYFKVISGTVYSGWEALLTTADPITIDTTSLAFALNPTVLSLVAGDMLTKVGQTFSIDLATYSGLESDNPGNTSGQLRVKVDTALLEKDQTTKINTNTGAVVAKADVEETFTIGAGDLTNQYLDLANVAGSNSVIFYVVGGGVQKLGDDYTINYTGGTNSKTRLTFAGGIATGGVSELVVGDVIVIKYRAFAQ